MDLLSGLRKGGASRGGRAEFSWESVKEDKDRENYLGHSLMAPVGRWQRGKNLTWYADGSSKQDAADARAEEIRRIKEAEQDALAEALGFPVDRRHRDPVDQKEVQKAIRESGLEHNSAGDHEEGQGLGFGRGGGMKELMRDELRDRVGATNDTAAQSNEYRPAREKDGSDDGRRSGRDDRNRHRSRRSPSLSRDSREKERRSRHHRSRSRSRRRHRHDDDRDSRRHRHRSSSRSRRDKGRDDRERPRERRRSRSRSRSPRRDHRR